MVEFVQPEELLKKIDLTLGDAPTNDVEMEHALEQTIRYSVKTGTIPTSQVTEIRKIHQRIIS